MYWSNAVSLWCAIRISVNTNSYNMTLVSCNFYVHSYTIQNVKTVFS